MADNVTITQGTGTSIAADDVGGVLYQRIKLAFGADGSAADVSSGLPLPVTDATAEASLASILAKLSADPATQTTLAAILAKLIAAPATEAKQDTTITALGAITETAPASDTASSGLNGRLQRIAQNITTLIASVLKVGGNVASGASDSGNPVKVGGVYNSIPPTYTNGQRGDLQLNASGQLIIASTNSDPATGTNQTTGKTRIGDLTETAPVSDTASSGLNGRLQRIAQRLTSLIGLLPAALGQGTMAQSLRVVLPSDQAAIPASQSGTWTVQPGNTANTTPWLMKTQRATTPTQSSVAGSASSVTLLASNSARLGATIYNDSSALLYVKLGATASTSSFTAILSGNSGGYGGYFEVPFGYTGVIDGIWASATGNARITEVA